MPKNSNLEYGSFYQTYVDKVDTSLSIIENLQESLNAVFNILGSLSEEQADFTYAEGKWTIKELVQHLTDTERVFSYRALAISRQEENNLPGFNENKYVWFSNAKNISFMDLLKEFSLIRKSNIAMFKGFTNEMLEQIGKANSSEISVNAIGYIMSGHVLHHLNIVKERYFA